MNKRHIGGQAVLEGVMMRGRDHWVLAVRRPDNQIVVKNRRINSLSHRFPFLNYVILRGIIALIDALTIGLQAINISAQEALEEGEEIGPKETIFIVTLAIILTLGLIVAFPALLAKTLDRYIANTILFNVVEGFFRIGVFVGYLLAISHLKDIRRVFEYHGAEHKVIHAYEADDELTPEATAKHSPLHLRCGTAFLLVVMVTLILVFSLLGRPPLLTRILSRLIVLPLVAGVSYEIIKLASKYENSFAIKILMAPGLWLQRITTRDPSADQLEVAICSIRKLLELEEGVP